jgi:hypothetical protein
MLPGRSALRPTRAPTPRHLLSLGSHPAVCVAPRLVPQVRLRERRPLAGCLKYSLDCGRGAWAGFGQVAGVTVFPYSSALHSLSSGVVKFNPLFKLRQCPGRPHHVNALELDRKRWASQGWKADVLLELVTESRVTEPCQRVPVDRWRRCQAAPFSRGHLAVDQSLLSNCILLMASR